METEEITTEEAPALIPQFCIDSDGRAEWLLRKLANNKAEAVRVTQQAQEIIEALEADTADLMFRYGAALEQYCLAKLAAEGNRRKSVRFLQGTCSFRWQGPAVKIKDAAAALEWAKENAPAMIQEETTERLDGDAFRRRAEEIRKQDGELLPGVEYSEGGDTFGLSFPTEVKPKKKERKP